METIGPDFFKDSPLFKDLPPSPDMSMFTDAQVEAEYRVRQYGRALEAYRRHDDEQARMMGYANAEDRNKKWQVKLDEYKAGRA